MKVKVDGLAVALEQELQNYSGEVKEAMVPAFTKISAQCVRKLKDSSPKRLGGYAKGWTRKVTVTDTGVSASVYNKKFAGLTHLLENGHAKTSGGRVPGIPHIGPVQEFASEEVLEALADILEGS